MAKSQILSRILVAQEPTPVLNTPNFTHTFSHMPLDKEGLMRELEMISPAGTSFEVIKMISPFIAEVKMSQYFSQKPLFIDIRFASTELQHFIKKLPPPSQMLKTLQNSLGLPYLWGGNTASGVPKIRNFYPEAKKLDEPLLTLKGLDCSGLLFEITRGYSPRNTSELVEYGRKISSPLDIKPLDILVWPGHVIILLNRKTCIESLAGQGVIATPLEKRLQQLKAQNFCIRRWI